MGEVYLRCQSIAVWCTHLLDSCQWASFFTRLTVRYVCVAKCPLVLHTTTRLGLVVPTLPSAHLFSVTLHSPFFAPAGRDLLVIFSSTSADHLFATYPQFDILIYLISGSGPRSPFVSQFGTFVFS